MAPSTNKGFARLIGVRNGQVRVSGAGILTLAGVRVKMVWTGRARTDLARAFWPVVFRTGRYLCDAHFV